MTLQSELETDVFLGESSCQDWLAVGMDQLKDKDCHGYRCLMDVCRCTHPEASPECSVSSGCTKDATEHVCAREEIRITILADFKRADATVWPGPSCALYHATIG